MQNTEQQTENEQKEPTKEQLVQLLAKVERSKISSTKRKARCEELMQRPGTKKWKPEKTAKMVRRLMTASQEIAQADEMIEQINFRLK